MLNLAEKLVKIAILGGKRKERRVVAKNFPESPGVYVFFENSEIIYIGKAINLKRRVTSYFDLELEPKTERMVREANFISYIKVTSDLESLLLEARLIRKYMPKYNIAAKDDKHPLYIKISKEIYPRVVTARKISETEKNIAFYGPFPSSTAVKTVLKMLRRIFPYSDHKLGKRGCLYSHIGLCNPCPSIIESTQENPELKIELKRKYLNNIRRIKAVLSGKFGGVRREMVLEMNVLSKEQRYEEAGDVRNRIKALDYITQPQMPTEFYMQNPNLYEDIKKNELNELNKILQRFDFSKNNLRRIECFDIAHFAGTNPTASMVVAVNGEMDKSRYRHFKVRQVKGNSDVDSLKEVIKRRLNHLEDWGKPDLIIVDGGKPQVALFSRELSGYNIPVVGIAKRFETLVIPVKTYETVNLKEFRLARGGALNLVTRIRNEAHRFARRYHHALISKELTHANENNS